MAKSKKKAAKTGFSGGQVRFVSVKELAYAPAKDLGRAVKYVAPDGDSAEPISKLVIVPANGEPGEKTVLFAKADCDTWAYAAVGEAEIEQIAQYLVDFLGKPVTPKQARAGK